MIDFAEEKRFMELLCSVKGLNGSVGRSLIEYFGSAKEIFHADDKTLSGLLSPGLYRSLAAMKRTRSGAEKDIEKRIASEHSPNSINFITFKEPAFPEKLSEIPDAPVGLWYIGSLPASDVPSVAVIGARECSSYGECVARDLGAALGRAKVQVISGMARGIDGISQQAARSEGGLSYGVLGSGADVCYPPSNRRLYDSLCSGGGIISLYPPGEAALPANFPPRNRIVSGLSDAVVVVEARQKSGTLITVDMALEQGREVYAVPGRITDRLSDGCNGLIGQGANVFLSPDIFLAELAEIISAIKNDVSPVHEERIKRRTSRSARIKKLRREYSGSCEMPAGLSDDEAKVLSVLGLTPMSAQDIIDRLKEYDYPAVSMILMQLLIEGYALQVGQGSFVRKY